MISVIIPVYNTEKYLHNCLNSLLKQTYEDFEVICIDDCSTDSSLEILEYYSKKDKRIKVLKNESNRGSGYSRNRGLDMAKGDYVFFLDSDDWISPNCFELLYSKSIELDLDLLIYQAILHYEDGRIINFENMYYMGFLVKYEDTVFNHLELPISELFSIAVAPWCKLYKRSFLEENNIRYTNLHLIQQDNPFFFEVILKAKRVSFLNKVLHTRNRREGSVMASLGDDRLFGRLIISELVLNVFLENREYYERYKSNVLHYITGHLMNEAYVKIEDKYKEEMFEKIKLLLNRYFNEYGLKEDILENVDDYILKRYGIIKE